MSLSNASVTRPSCHFFFTVPSRCMRGNDCRFSHSHAAGPRSAVLCLPSTQTPWRVEDRTSGPDRSERHFGRFLVTGFCRGSHLRAGADVVEVSRSFVKFLLDKQILREYDLVQWIHVDVERDEVYVQMDTAILPRAMQSLVGRAQSSLRHTGCAFYDRDKELHSSTPRSGDTRSNSSTPRSLSSASVDISRRRRSRSRSRSRDRGRSRDDYSRTRRSRSRGNSRPEDSKGLERPLPPLLPPPQCPILSVSIAGEGVCSTVHVDHQSSWNLPVGFGIVCVRGLPPWQADLSRDDPRFRFEDARAMLKLLESVGLLMPSRLQNNSSVPVAYFRALDNVVHLYFNTAADASVIHDRAKLITTSLQSTLPALSAALLQ